MWATIAKLRMELNAPIHPDVLEQYDLTFVRFNKMREQLGRDQIPAMTGDVIGRWCMVRPGKAGQRGVMMG
jgi:hypothetical protein